MKVEVLLVTIFRDLLTGRSIRYLEIEAQCIKAWAVTSHLLKSLPRVLTLHILSWHGQDIARLDIMAARKIAIRPLGSQGMQSSAQGLVRRHLMSACGAFRPDQSEAVL